MGHKGGVGFSSEVYQQLGRASSMQPNTISFSAKMSFNVPQGEVVGFRGEVYQPFGRASSMQQNTISVKYLPSVPARSYSQPHQLSISAGIYITKASQQFGTMNIRVRIRIIRFRCEVIYVCTYLYTYQSCMLLRVSIMTSWYSTYGNTTIIRPNRYLCPLIHMIAHTTRYTLHPLLQQKITVDPPMPFYHRWVTYMTAFTSSPTRKATLLCVATIDVNHFQTQFVVITAN